MKKFIISIDQGTTSSRVILFDTRGNIVFVSQYEFKQYFPKNGWVEHNPNEIWSTTLKALKQVINKAKKLKGHILTIGITNQRETTILWNKKTGKPIYNAIVWQDRRTQDYCKLLKKKNYENLFRNKTGLFIDPYFSATKIKWILDNVKISKKLLGSNDLLFGTVDTFLIWKLTKGKQHLTEASNASRTMLYNINNNKWDKEILKKLNIPQKILPEVKNSADNFGKTDKKITGVEISISAVLGDQQAAAFGQTCFEKGSIKSTYGTGAFVIMNTGPKKINSKNKLLTTICYRLNNKNTYLEHAAKILRHDMHSGINTYIPRGIKSLERRIKPEQVKEMKIESSLRLIKDGLDHAQRVYRGVYEFTNLVKENAVLEKEEHNLGDILKDYLRKFPILRKIKKFISK